MRFLLFSLVFLILAIAGFGWSIEHAIEFSSFAAAMLKFASFLFVIALIDYVVLWEYETFDEIITKRNIPYAIFILGLFIVCAAAVLSV